MTHPTNPITAAEIREIVAERGLSDAEFHLGQSASWFGSDAVAEARAELNRLIDAEYAADLS